jgi:hypothetical protein
LAGIEVTTDAIVEEKTRIIDIDLSAYFDNVRKRQV